MGQGRFQITRASRYARGRCPFLALQRFALVLLALIECPQKSSSVSNLEELASFKTSDVRLLNLC